MVTDGLDIYSYWSILLLLSNRMWWLTDWAAYLS